ncbi:unnamed protein product [Aspergillus oryzae]|nr:unnamed protein product [Aspergillus oryzae]
MQLLVIFAGIHNTTVTATNVLYNLAVSPEYMQPLHEEICKAISDNDGTLTSRALQQVEKLDSFMKETIRFYPQNSLPSRAKRSKALNSPAANTSHQVHLSKHHYRPYIKMIATIPTVIPSPVSDSTRSGRAVGQLYTLAINSSRPTNRISSLDMESMRVQEDS